MKLEVAGLMKTFAHYYWHIARVPAIHKVAWNCLILTDIMSHLKYLNVKLQVIKHTAFIWSLRFVLFRKRKCSIQHDINYFPRLLEQNKGEKDTRYVHLSKSWVPTWCHDLATFCFENRCCCFFKTFFWWQTLPNFQLKQNTRKWADTAKIQLELSGFQE